ncbi:class I SAM-dependent methyltransferase [Boseongicola aestuarii]|uniref:Mg-protoporphyrin IX methyl transferase n=1 Tax=Boseongicola aestuarii TaxID=1470561 RepID=A0A238IX94_9RHOB|nr:class I SAM-dependent methyltransferase [Boseongicola aestuarii]SMX22475.1 Mg-protoporphyrin IX methyl transferase [Boseongicola aestuarii]
MDKLLEAYSGDRARDYDSRRSKSSRWKAEIAAFESMLSKSKATSVLDCPFGTGRWITQYAEHDLNVIGVDLSAGMLEEAEAKIAALPEAKQERFSLKEKSIFDLSPTDFPDQPNLIVCVRFLNWISASEVEKVLDLLSAFQAKEMIVGASVVPKKSGPLARFWYWISLKLINFRHPNRPAQYVHDEGGFLNVLNSHGWRIADQVQTMKRNARVNYLYHCIRD